MPRFIAALPLMLALADVGPVAAGMRCGTWLVVPGDHQLEVLSKCGEPAQSGPGRAAAAWWVPGHGYLPARWVEEWTYNFGPRRFMHRVQFLEGRVQRISTLGYGFRDDQ